MCMQNSTFEEKFIHPKCQRNAGSSMMDNMVGVRIKNQIIGSKERLCRFLGEKYSDLIRFEE